jgi:hypothetical protein
MKNLSALLNKNPFALIDEIKKEVKKLNLKVTKTSPYSYDEDAYIELGGLFKDYHISIGLDCYTVGREFPNGTSFFIDGEGNLVDELNRAKKRAMIPYFQLILVEFDNADPIIVTVTSEKPITIDIVAAYYIKNENFDPDEDSITFLDEIETLSID